MAAVAQGTPSEVHGFSVVGRPQAGPGYFLCGDRYSVVNLTLMPGQSWQSEPGVMMYMSENVTMNSRFAGWRAFSGEGLAKNQYINNGQNPEFMGVAPNMPMAVVLPVDIHTIPGGLNCKRGVFMAGHESVKVGVKLLPAASLTACCCGGMPPIIQEVSGQGTAFLSAGGTIVKKTLAPGQKLLVDSDSVVAFGHQVNYDVRQVGTFMTCCCGGEGCFNTELTGPGEIYLQTLSYEKLRRLVVTVQEEGQNNGGGGGAPPQGNDMQR